MQPWDVLLADRTPPSAGPPDHVCTLPLPQLALVTGIVRNRLGDGRVEVTCRRYCLPEHTHRGREPHHQAREVFLLCATHFVPVESVWDWAVVCAEKVGRGQRRVAAGR